MMNPLDVALKMKTESSAARDAVADLCQGLARLAPMTELAELASVVADVLVEPVKSVSTCKRGCSHCCMQSSIMIDEADAKLLAQVTGRQMDVPDYEKSVSFRGVPCVFLDTSSNNCSVYEHRPMICRISTSIDDPIKCKTEEFRQMLSTDGMFTQIVRIVGPENKVAYFASRGDLPPADIRQFFKPSAILGSA